MDSRCLQRARFPSRAATADMVTIPVTDAIHKTLRAAARASGISLTQWAQAVLLRAAAETPRDSHSIAS
jgi:predicted HicB family RNase H-like nuclease